MKVAVLVLVVAVAAIANGQQQCQQSFQNFFSCMKQKFEEKKDSITMQTVFDKQDFITAAFTNNGCAPPDFSVTDPLDALPAEIREVLQTMQQMKQNVPESSKQCFKQEMKNVLLRKAQQCLNTEGVQIQLPANLELPEPPSPQAFFGDNEALKAAIATKIQAAKALRQCTYAQKSAIAGEMQVLKQEKREQVCAAKAECKQLSGASPQCIAQGEQIKAALCSCAQDAVGRIKEKLDALQAQVEQSGRLQPRAVMSVFRQEGGQMMQIMTRCRASGGGGFNPLRNIQMFRRLSQSLNLQPEEIREIVELIKQHAGENLKICDQCDSD